MRDAVITVSVGVMAYNEARNIGRLLEALAGQRLSTARLARVVVVSSGSTDGTDEIVEGWARRDGRVQLVRQATRQGKSAAINLFLERAEGDVFVLESGDTVPAPDCLERLVAPFSDPEVGMTGARPVPVDDPERFMGFVVHMLWRLHHRLALRSPKLGEMVAFRSFVRSIPHDSAVDEASIEAIVAAAGKRLVYVPEAVVWNKGASTIRDFLRQRRRIYAGHLWLSRFQHYEVSTRGVGGIVGVLREDLDRRPRALLWTAAGVLLEAAGRALGAFDFHVLRKNPHTWAVSESTKSLEAAGARPGRENR
ncbi:MAG: glycosyltransferase [Candidatus Eisenbacteria bacterium]|nr:glycosyltransferase [Candidatus Eisenbacteria bacterium]